MLPDPVSIAASAPTAALVFRVIKSDGYGSERRDDAGLFAAIASHEPANGSRVERHFLKINEVRNAVSPITGGTSKQTASVSIQVIVPPFGWTQTDKIALVKVLTDYLADAEVTVANFLLSQS